MHRQHPVDTADSAQCSMALWSTIMEEWKFDLILEFIPLLLPFITIVALIVHIYKRCKAALSN